MEVVVLSDVSLNVNGNANVGNVLVNKVLSLMKSQIIYHQCILLLIFKNKSSEMKILPYSNNDLKFKNVLKNNKSMSFQCMYFKSKITIASM